MTLVRLDPAPAARLEGWRFASPLTYHRVQDWLDELETRPHTRECRQHRIGVMWARAEWIDGVRIVMLWEFEGNSEDVIVVRHLGEDTFTI